MAFKFNVARALRMHVYALHQRSLVKRRAICTYAYIHIYTGIYVRIYICMCNIYVYVHMHVCKRVCIQGYVKKMRERERWTVKHERV